MRGKEEDDIVAGKIKAKKKSPTASAFLSQLAKRMEWVKKKGEGRGRGTVEPAQVGAVGSQQSFLHLPKQKLPDSSFDCFS